MEPLGSELIAMCRSARESVVLVAPFIKRHALARLLAEVPNGVAVTCVTRWRPQEIAAGVSDLEIWEEFRDHPLRLLLLRQDLHAKYYRSDGRCVVGSANLTGSALGWAAAPNLELLVAVALDAPGLVGFETDLLKGSICVDAEIVAQTQSIVDLLPQAVVPDAADAQDAMDGHRSVEGPDRWLPELRQPSDLFLAYSGRGGSLSAASRESARSDLAVLRVPADLDGRPFRDAVGFALLTMPIIRALDEFVASVRRFGEVADFLDQRRPSDRDAARTWQGLFRWLVYFLPDRYEYRRPRHSELIVRRPSRAALDEG
jgi:hypothetical protein